MSRQDSSRLPDDNSRQTNRKKFTHPDHPIKNQLLAEPNKTILITSICLLLSAIPVIGITGSLISFKASIRTIKNRANNQQPLGVAVFALCLSCLTTVITLGVILSLVFYYHFVQSAAGNQQQLINQSMVAAQQLSLEINQSPNPKQAINQLAINQIVARYQLVDYQDELDRFDAQCQAKPNSKKKIRSDLVRQLGHHLEDRYWVANQINPISQELGLLLVYQSPSCWTPNPPRTN